MDITQIIFIVSAFVMAALGIIGAVVPIIPGAVVSLGALILGYFGFLDTEEPISLTLLIAGIFIVAIVTVVDFIVPSAMTKRDGGSNKAATGSLVGTIVGSFFVPPLGMILGAFLGALLGEYIHTSHLGKREYKVAFNSFLGFLLGTGLKLIVSILILIVLIYHLI